MIEMDEMVGILANRPLASLPGDDVLLLAEYWLRTFAGCMGR
jgi:hypothetical protein